VLVGVVLAEEKLESGRQLGADTSRGTAAVAAVRSSQLGTGQSCIHGLSVLVHSLSQTYTVFALFPDRYRVCRFSRLPGGRSLTWPTVTYRPDALVHLCGAEEWSRARGLGGIRPEGPFLHLSTPEQVHLPANRLYRGRDDLVLLHIDPALLDSPVRWEPGVATDPESMLFPHLYGPLSVRAVINVTAYPPAPDGTFPGPPAGST
jgi:uncharacterized protein (DUF952 family)